MNKIKCLKIIGNQKVNGIIKTSGSKNASLPLIAASLLVRGKVKLHNVPRIDDVFKMLEILKYLNVDYSFKENDLVIDSSNYEYKNLNIPIFSSLRGSYYFLPVLLEKKRELRFSKVGGCNFCSRPIDIHLDVYNNAGVTSCIAGEDIVLYCEEPQEINYTFNKKSLGATINGILLGIKLNKKVKLFNPSLEEEVLNLIEFLKKGGIEFEIDEESICFTPKPLLNEVEIDVIPDRIEAETFALFGLALGRIGIFNFKKEHHQSFIKFMDDNKFVYSLEKDFLIVYQEEVKYSNKLIFDSYPFLPTDIGPVLLSFLLLGKRMFLLEDKVYPERLYNLFFYRDCYSFNGKQLLVNPLSINKENKIFYGKNLRETMAYLFYCLTHEGVYHLYGVEHVTRGYENIINKLVSLNCKIEVIYED